MKQLGNLAIICAQRSDLCLSIYDGSATVHIGCGAMKEQITINWSDNEAFNKLIYELNHGKYRQEGVPAEAAIVQSVYVCYEVNSPDLAREAGAVNELTLFWSKESRDEWITARLAQAKEDDFVVDEDIGGPEKLAELITQNDSVDITLFRHEHENWNEHYDIVATLIDIKI